MLHHLNLRQWAKERSRSQETVNIAVLGAGWYGYGLVYELKFWPGMQARVVIDRTADKAVKAYLNAGIPRERIIQVETAAAMKKAFADGKYIAGSDMKLLEDLPEQIDVVFDASGQVLPGVVTALATIRQKRHYITINAEMDATIGFQLAKLAREKGVVYSNSDGDQPGVLARMIAEVKLMGFDIAVAGNGKGFLNCHAVPDDIMKFVGPGQNPQKITSFTDGSKQSFEMVVLANGTDLVPDIRGMHGPRVDKEDIVKCLTEKKKSEKGIVDFVFGKTTSLGMTVFVIGKKEKDYAYEDLRYLKMGDGPYYLFFRDYHLCYFETPRTIAEAVIFNEPTISPVSWNSDVLTVAKRDLKKGEKFDGIGGYTAYGLIDRAEIIRNENLLPLGLAEFATLKKDIAKDTPVTYDMVEFKEENIALKLRREMEQAASVSSGRDVS